MLGTLLVVGAEFALLHAVYVRAAPARDRLQTAARLQAAASVVDSAGSSARDVAALRTAGRQATAELAHAGVPAGQLRPVRAALAAPAGNPTRWSAKVADAADQLHKQFAARVTGYDHQADLIYVALLLGASVGWMVWFRRLVARHRALQADLTEQQSLALGEQRLAALVRNAADVVLVCDLDAVIGFAAPSIAKVLGRDPHDVHDTRVTDLVDPADRIQFRQALATVPTGADGTLRIRMTHLDGRLLYADATITNLVADPSVGGLVVTLRDVTAQVELQAELTHQAFHDPLTGLANRQLFSDRLQHALQARSDSARPLVVLFCDLDEFKNVNDSLGHGVGDLLLSEVAQRLGRCTRQGDTAARLGGDEFALLLEATEIDEALEIADRIQQELHEPIVVDDHQLSVSASIGVTAALPGTVSREDVLRNADVAMYLAKDSGRDSGKGGVAVYDEQQHAAALERLELRADLQQAIRADELSVHYQPTVLLETGEIVGFEALARWTHPVRGPIPPIEFVPIAEQTGLIHELGSAVLRQACAAAVSFGLDAGRRISMSVNVTAAQLARADFGDEVLAVLAESGLSPDRLVLEITESTLLQRVDMVRDRLQALRDRGVRIAVDDFGTGYSSLSYLRDLPLDILKVDKAFVDHVTEDETDAALTEAIVTMSRSMNLTTVAEGVEHPEQAAWLSDARCALGQGYLWSRPVPLADARRLLLDAAPVAA